MSRDLYRILWPYISSRSHTVWIDLIGSNGKEIDLLIEDQSGNQSTWDRYVIRFKGHATPQSILVRLNRFIDSTNRVIDYRMFENENEKQKYIKYLHIHKALEKNLGFRASR